MRASPLEYVSMGPRHRTRAVTLRCCSPAFYSFHPLTLPSHYYFPLLPPPYAIHASAYITKRRPRLADACTVLRVSCVYVDTEAEREFMESVRVCLGIQLERAIGPNGMKFLCGQTQERSRFLFSRPTSAKPRPYLALNLLRPKFACPFARSLCSARRTEYLSKLNACN